MKAVIAFLILLALAVAPMLDDTERRIAHVKPLVEFHVNKVVADGEIVHRRMK